MHVFSLGREQVWDPEKHVEKILGRFEEGDVAVACWEPGQVSPKHCHPEAVEIYFCFSGSGVMRTADQTVDVIHGSCSSGQGWSWRACRCWWQARAMA